MIGIIFHRGNEVVEVRVEGNNLYFRNSQYGAQFAPIESIQLNYEGVVKEHPDLRDDPEWSTKAIERLKEHISDMSSEDEKADYVIKELSGVGYKPYAKQKQGQRIQRL